MNDFDYTKPLSVEYSHLGKVGEGLYEMTAWVQTEESKEQFDSLLAKWDEIFQREVFFTEGRMEHSSAGDSSILRRYSWKKEFDVNTNVNELGRRIWYNENGEQNLSLLIFTHCYDGYYSKYWDVLYIPNAFDEKKKHFVFNFRDMGDSAYLSLKLCEKAYSSAPYCETKFGGKCEIKYAESDEYYQALGFKDSRAAWKAQGGEFAMQDRRRYFFAAIGKEGVFEHGRDFTERLFKRILDEERSAADAKKSAEKKALADALGDL